MTNSTGTQRSSAIGLNEATRCCKSELRQSTWPLLLPRGRCAADLRMFGAVTGMADKRVAGVEIDEHLSTFGMRRGVRAPSIEASQGNILWPSRA